MILALERNCNREILVVDVFQMASTFLYLHPHGTQPAKGPKTRNTAGGSDGTSLR
jgi:hypothetical protein